MESAAFDQAKPSWQSRLFNCFARIFFKPLLALVSLAVMRHMTAVISRLSGKKPPAGIRVSHYQGSQCEGEWVEPEDAAGSRIILYFPGGGFVVRTPAAHRRFLIKLCRQLKTRGLLVFYRLAPEHPFPRGFEDCIEAYQNLLRAGHDPKQIVIAGDSAGGNMVLAALMYLRDNNIPLPACGVLLSSLLDLTFTGESRQSNAKRDSMLPNDGKAQIERIYHPGTPDNHPYVSPGLGDFTGLPPMLGQVGSIEILRDDTVRAAERARQANVPFVLEVWRGMPHDWQLVGFIPEAGQAVQSITAFIDRYCPAD